MIFEPLEPRVLMSADVLTYKNDNARTGQDLQETVLNHANVNAATFGKVGFLDVDGKVDAQPLYVSSLAIPGNGIHNVLVVASEHDSVYAFDADSGATLWHVSVLGNGEVPSDPRGCDQVTPEIGVTATPVIDRNLGPNGTVYVVAMSKDGAGNYFQRLHALNLATGAEEFGGPVTITASYPGTGDDSVNGSVIFDPKQYKERPALLLSNGLLYLSWASHCDIREYTSWLMAYDPLTLRQTAVLNFTPNGSEGAFWGSGGGPAADPAGAIYLLAGNGTFDATLNASGLPNRGDFGESFIKVNPTGSPHVTNYFTPFNQADLSARDVDLGSGAPMLLPNLTNAAGKVMHLAVAAGKDGNLYVINRAHPGKYDPAGNTYLYQELPNALPNGIWSTPAYFNHKVYYGAVDGPLRAFRFVNAKLEPNPISQSAMSFGYPGASPAVSANGTLNGIVWVAENGTTAVLRAFGTGNLAHELYDSNQAPNGRDQFGAGNKFITPTVANGRVYVATTNGVAVFGLLAGATVPLASVIPAPVVRDDAAGSAFTAIMDGIARSLLASRDALLQ